MPDEFGGIAVDDDSTDEFGGVPVNDEEQTPEAALRRFGQILPQPTGDIYGMPLLGDEIVDPNSTIPPIRRRGPEGIDTFEALKPTPRIVQNAYDVMKAYGGRVGFAGMKPTSEQEFQEELASPDQPVSPGAKVAAGTIAGGLNLAKTFTTPEGVGLLALGGIPGIAGRVISAGFLVDMLRQAPAVYQKLGDAFGRNDLQAEAEALFDAVVHGGFTVGTGHGAFKGASPSAVREWAQDFVTKTPREERAKIYGTENVEPPPAAIPQPFAEPGTRIEGKFGEPVPETETQTFVGDKPVEVLEINKKKKTALVRDANDPNAPPDVVKLSDLEEKEVPKGGESNASEVGKTAEVYGDVRSQPGEGAGKVPVEEGSGRVQSQADRGVQPAEGQNREVPLELTPTIKAGDVMVTGKSHAEALDAATKSGDANKIMAAMMGERGFTDQNGKFYTRKEAVEIFKQQGGDVSKLIKPAEGLHSEDLRDAGMLKHLEEKKAPVEQPEETLPIDKLEGPVPEGAVPVKIQRADGSVYEAFRTSEGGEKVPPMIAKVKPSGEKGTPSLSHKPLGKGETIIEGPKTAEEYRAAVEQSPRAAKIARLDKLRAQLNRLSDKGKLTPAEAEEYRALGKQARDLIFELQRPLKAKDIPSEEERKSTLSTDVVLAANKDLMSNKDVYDPLMEAAEGVYYNRDTAVDDVVNGKNPNLTEQQLYDAFANTREALRKQYGDTIPLFRATGKQKSKPTQNWATTREFAEQFGKNIIERNVPVDDVLAVNVGPRGKYHEIIVRERKEARPITDVPAFSGLGIVPPGLGSLMPAVRKTLTALNRTRLALRTIWRGTANRKIMDQAIDAADNKANIVGQQMGNRMRIGTGRMERMATMAVVEANGNQGRLNDFLRQALTAGNTDAVDAVRYAQNNWARLQTAARRARRILDWQISSEQNAGIATEYRDAYVPHIYDRDLLMGAGRPFVIAGGSGTGSGFKKGRTFETIFDAIEAGYTPKTLDISDLIEHRVRTGQKIINRKTWAEGLAGLTDPTDGLPLAAPLIRKSRGPGQPSYEVAPTGYAPVEILPGVRLGIHEAYVPLFRALTGESFVSGSVPGKLLLQGGAAIKHGLLMFDTFHASRIIQKALSLAPKEFGPQVPNLPSFAKKGASLLEYSDGDLNRAVSANLITPEIANWVRANRADARMLIDSGLNVGRVEEALYSSVMRQVPVVGRFNKWVFEKVTRGAIMEAGLIELERISQAKPNVPRGTIARQVARDLNAYFGNLGRQGIFKSKSAQDIARLVALAPQWVESMARTELKGAAQAVKGVTYDPIVHKTLLTGSIGKGVAQGLLAYFVGTQILNYVTRGHSTFQNEEEGHKLDAWIPGPKGSHGFFLSPFSVVAELTHDMMRYSHKEPTKLDAAMRIASNKSSPMTRALKVLMTGKDYDGKQLTDTWKRIRAAGFALAPTPLPLAPTIKGSQYPGQTHRQALGSLGFKVEPAESATQQIANKAKQFLITSGKKKPAELELSDEPAYYKLRDLLRKDDESGARDMLAEIQKTHNPKQIMTAMRNHVRRPFTGSRRDEAAFRAGLNPKEKDMYDRARDEQREEFQKFLQLWYNRK